RLRSRHAEIGSRRQKGADAGTVANANVSKDIRPMMRTFLGDRLAYVTTAVVTTLTLASTPAAAQRDFNPFAGVDSLRYRFDLARNFYPSETEAERDRARLSARIAAWVQASNSASRRGDALADFISSADSILTASG